MCDAIDDLGEDLTAITQITAPSGSYHFISSFNSADDDDGNVPNIVGQILLPGSLSLSEFKPGLHRVLVSPDQLLSSFPGFLIGLNTKGLSPPWERVELVSASFLSCLFASSARSLAPPTV